MLISRSMAFVEGKAAKFLVTAASEPPHPLANTLVYSMRSQGKRFVLLPTF